MKKTKKVVIYTLVGLVSFVVLFNLGLIISQLKGESQLLSSAIDKNNLAAIVEMLDLDLNLMIDEEPAIFYAVESNNQSIVAHFVSNGANLMVEIKRNDLQMTPAFYARYFDKKESELGLLSAANNDVVKTSIQTSINAAQEKLDEEFQKAIMDAVDEDLKRLNKQ